MDSVKRLIVDVSSVAWMSLLAGEDKEHGYKVQHEGRVVQVNSATFGYECAINHLVGVLNEFGLVPSDMILVVEGANSKVLRRSILETYKATRDSRPPEAYTEFNNLKQMLVTSLGEVGATSVSQDGLESDDVIAYLARELQGEVIILTNDGDMCALVAPATADKGAVHVYRRSELDENPYGPFEHKYITLYKALVGDSSDNFPGAKGFGPKAFLDLYCLFAEDGLDALTELIETRTLHRLSEDVGDLPSLQKIIDGAEMVYKSWDCARLYPHKVNTLRMPLQWQAGMVKPRTKETDERLAHWAGQVRLVHAGTYPKALEFFQSKISETPFFTLDIETSTCDESDDWLMTAKGKSDDSTDIGVDVFGSTLTGLAVTFGNNRQYTYYMPVRHVETDEVKNVPSLDVLALVDLIPHDVDHVIQNVSFELTVLYQEWSEYWDTGEWQGFIPSAVDTKIESSYVDENEKSGLKQRSLQLLGYQQVSYAEVTSRSGAVGTLPKGGRVVSTFPKSLPVLDEKGKPTFETLSVITYLDDEGIVCDEAEAVSHKETTELIPLTRDEMWETRQYRMNELTAQDVLAYGADDTICTAALHNFYRIIMEIEKTWKVYREVEILPAYVTALAYVQGAKVSLERLKELEREDDKAFDEASKIMDEFLIRAGWEGTVCPVYEEITPTAIKEAYLIVTGEELKTSVRTISKFVPMLEDKGAHLLASLVRDENLKGLNGLVAQRFTGKPEMNYGSPKQMQKLLYDTLDLPVRIVNKLTPDQRAANPALAAAVSKHNKIWQGSTTVELTDEDKVLLRQKAATDDTAVDFALAMDATEDQKVILNAMTTLKTISTRRGLYYKPYPLLTHWKDGKLHSSMNQSAAATRRYTSSGPNLQQMPKKGAGVKIREVIVPHKNDAVICSIDFSGQELRLMAGQSGDRNMLACYIGDKLKDIHSITASGAMSKMWTQKVVDELAEKFGSDLDPSDVDYIYDLFVTLHKRVEDDEVKKKADDLRKTAKNVNFAAQFDSQAAKLAQMLILSVADAQAFLDAKYAMFPDVETWKDGVRDRLKVEGFVTTMLGGRRHLRTQMLSDDKWEVERAGRQGPNFMIQGSAAEMTKLAMARLWESGVLTRLDMVFIAPIHDELVWSVSRHDAVESIKIVHAAMTEPYANLPVPILGSISIGPNFGKQYECGDCFDEVSINAQMDKFSIKDELSHA